MGLWISNNGLQFMVQQIEDNSQGLAKYSGYYRYRPSCRLYFNYFIAWRTSPLLVICTSLKSITVWRGYFLRSLVRSLVGTVNGKS